MTNTTSNTTTENSATMSTADLAYGNPGTGNGTTENIRQETVSTSGSTGSPLFETSDAQTFRSRWQDIQAGFVDDPREAVHGADALVAETMKHLAQVFADERASLESQWSSGGDVDTEALRVALQRYRSFFDRLLSV
jgi:hypothetical protein